MSEPDLTWQSDYLEELKRTLGEFDGKFAVLNSQNGRYTFTHTDSTGLSHKSTVTRTEIQRRTAVLRTRPDFSKE